MQTEATRFARGAWPRIQATRSGSRRRAPSPPGTISRSGGSALVLLAEVAVRGDDQAACRPDLDTAEAGGADPVGALALVVAGAGEDLKRAGDVEGLHAVEQDDQYCSHASQFSWPRSWQQ